LLGVGRDPPGELVARLEVGIVGSRGLGKRRAGSRGRFREQPSLEGGHDAARDVVLQRERVGGGPVVALGPEVRLVRRADQLGGDPQAISLPSHASLDEVVDTQLAADLVDGLAGLLVDVRGRARDDRQPLRPEARERGRQLLREAVAQELLGGIAGEVLERKDDEHHASRRRDGGTPREGRPDHDDEEQSCGDEDSHASWPGPTLRPRTRRLGRRVRLWSLPNSLDRREEAIAAARKRLEVARRVRLVAERGADLLHAVVQPLLEIDERLAPDLALDLLAGHELARAPGEEGEDLRRLLLKVDEDPRPSQLTARQLELERAEAERAHWRGGDAQRAGAACARQSSRLRSICRECFSRCSA
jgi:hypothetical protein